MWTDPQIRCGSRILYCTGIRCRQAAPAFERPGLGESNAIRDWDLWPDRRGFLMVKLDEIKTEPATEMILVQNWFEELKRLVPTK